MNGQSISGYLDELFSSGASALAKSIVNWRAGIAYEMDFWSRWVERRGLEWPEEFKERTSPKPLVPWLATLLPAIAKDRASILDVGAGPITKLGHFIEGREVEFVAVDPLALQYEAILRKFTIEPPCTTQLAFAEDLTARFERDYFDLVCCTNSLDHAIEPVWGLLEMIQVARVGGFVYLGHRRNEAEFEGYSGFHQWNFDAREGAFVIWNRFRSYNVSEMLRGFAEVACSLNDSYLTVRIRKLADFPMEPLQYQRRLRANTLAALLISASADTT